MKMQDYFSKSKRIAVIGDIMLDRYYDGKVDRISPEAPVPILKVIEVFDRPGGAANVAVNIAKLGLNVTLIGYVGNDNAAEDLRSILNDFGIDFIPIISKKNQTIVKIRALSHNQQIIRIDFENNFNNDDHNDLINLLTNRMNLFDSVILSDYAKGTLEKVDDIIELCDAYSIPVFVDPKGNDFSRYKGATIITPNISEFSAVAGQFLDERDFEQKALQMRSSLGLKYLLVTRGEDGMSLFADLDQAYTVKADAREVYDVTGAGDTVIATLAAAYTSGVPIEQSVMLSNIAAGIVVGRTGTSAVSADEILRRLREVNQLDGISPLEAIRNASLAGETIVMTNGCFDILHAGHITYLEKAKALGSRLVVAVNSDESVRRLKGSGRPINTLGDRIAMLSALRCVDWVLPFDGTIDDNGNLHDTPLSLICAIKPDILVKGGDYTVETVVGASEVFGWGGRVEIIDLVEGRSTTAIVERLSHIAAEGSA